MSNEPMLSVIKDLQDTMIALAQIDELQSVDREVWQPVGEASAKNR